MRLPTGFSGRVVERGDLGFDDARSMFNSSIECFPAAILYCQSESDVQLAVQAAGEAGRRVVVRSTGHSVSGRSIADDAIVVDLSDMRGVNALGHGVFACQGGAHWKDLDAATSQQGSAVTGGTVSSTGVGGLTLGGGIGWLLPSSGLACDSLIGADLVMANGKKSYISDGEDPEFMRCLRGVGHGLAVVTQLHFAARPLQKVVAGSMTVNLSKPLSKLVEQICDLITRPPRSLMLSPSFIYRDSHPVMSLDLALHAPSSSALARIRRLASDPAIVENTVRPRSYVSLQSMLDNPKRAGLRARWMPRYLNSIEPDLILRLAEAFRNAPSRESIIFLEHYHGEYAHPFRPSAFPGREAQFSVLATASWSLPMDDSLNHCWLENIDHEIGKWKSTREPYLNYASILSPTDPHEWLSAYLDVKKRIDPEGLFITARSHASRDGESRGFKRK